MVWRQRQGMAFVVVAIHIPDLQISFEYRGFKRQVSSRKNLGQASKDNLSVVRRPLFLFGIGTLLMGCFIKAMRQSDQPGAQFLQLALLPVHHIAEVVIGALQIRDLELKMFKQFLIHGWSLRRKLRGTHHSAVRQR